MAEVAKKKATRKRAPSKVPDAETVAHTKPKGKPERTAEEKAATKKARSVAAKERTPEARKKAAVSIKSSWVKRQAELSALRSLRQELYLELNSHSRKTVAREQLVQLLSTADTNGASYADPV